MSSEIRLVVKSLTKGTETIISVPVDAKVSRLKTAISSKLGHAEIAQKLIYNGNVLSDSQTLRECKVVEGSKIHLVLKKNAEDSPSSPTTAHFIQELRMFLRPHFAEPDSKAIIEKFIEAMDRSISSMSLDDMERYATELLAQKDSERP